MTPTQFLTIYLQPTLEPVLSSDELALILELASTVDKNGLQPTDTNWIPTYNYSKAISEGWMIKAAKVAGNYHFKDDTLERHREQVYDHCLKMANEYKSKAINGPGGTTNTGGIVSVSVKPTLYKDTCNESTIHCGN